MSTTTASLRLFKYDTVADANVPFSINDALNANWDKIDTVVTNKVDRNLTDLTDTGRHVIDGQWVDAGNIQLSNTTALGIYTIDLSSYLPNDSYKYEVLIYGRLGSNANDVNYYEVASTVIPTNWTVLVNAATGQIGASAVVFPIGTDHTLTIGIASNNGYTPSWCECRLMAYRRVGTNS